MKFTKALTAVAASAMLVAPMAANAATLMNTVSSSTTSISGHICSESTSWDQYAGAQITVSETSSAALQGVVLGDGLHSNSSSFSWYAPEYSSSSQGGGQAAAQGAVTQNFAAEVNLTLFRGGDYNHTTINGQINQVQTQFSSGIQTSFAQ